MAVVINEFEVVASPPPAPAAKPGAGASSQADSPPAGPTAHDLAGVLRHLAGRAERVRAH